MNRARPLRALAALALAVAACAQQSAPAPNPASADDPLRVWERDVSVDGSRAIMARNDDKVPHTVTSLRLYDCRNVKIQCAEFSPNITVKPGETVTVLTIDPAVRSGKVSYKFDLKYQ